MDGACIFCKSEMGFLKITGKGYNMGLKCYAKSIKKDISWNDETTKMELRELLG